MEFWKMNGAGNDFIVVDDRRNAIPENRWPGMSMLWPDRYICRQVPHGRRQLPEKNMQEERCTMWRHR